MSTRNQTRSHPGKAETFAPAGAEGGAYPSTIPGYALGDVGGGVATPGYVHGGAVGVRPRPGRGLESAMTVRERVCGVFWRACWDWGFWTGVGLVVSGQTGEVEAEVVTPVLPEVRGMGAGF